MTLYAVNTFNLLMELKWTSLMSGWHHLHNLPTTTYWLKTLFSPVCFPFCKSDQPPGHIANRVTQWVYSTVFLLALFWVGFYKVCSAWERTESSQVCFPAIVVFVVQSVADTTSWKVNASSKNVQNREHSLEWTRFRFVGEYLWQEAVKE